MIPEVNDLAQVSTFQQTFANKTLEWLGEDNEERFSQLANDPKQRLLLEKNGWMERSITYQFNSQGFRGHEFDPAGDYFCVFGDSVTFGSALNLDQTYGGLLEERLGIKCYNFGQAGGSNDTSVRWAMTYLKNLRPRFVIFQRTFDHRLEWLTRGNVAMVYGIQSYGGGQPPETRGSLFTDWIDIDINRSINLAKNLMCMGFICQQISVPLIEINISDFFLHSEDRARDLLHPGPRSHQQNANLLLDQLNRLGLL